MICTTCKAEVTQGRIGIGPFAPPGVRCLKCSEGTPTMEEQIATLTAERDQLAAEMAEARKTVEALTKERDGARTVAALVLAERDTARASVAALRAGLEKARFFCAPAVNRGPAIPEWCAMRDSTAALMADTASAAAGFFSEEEVRAALVSFHAEVDDRNCPPAQAARHAGEFLANLKARRAR